MPRPLTLMAVHAHPDDEATSTGGVLARYAAEGVTTVLVTCTNGALGDSGSVRPGEADHRTEDVVAARAAELAASCRILGVTHSHQLGYLDSGMAGWAQNDAPGSFWTTPVDEAAARLGALIEQHRPDVVLTYDAQGFYGHPDHIQAHRVTLAALDRVGSPAKLYFTTVRSSSMALFRRRMKEAGEQFPGTDQPAPDRPADGQPAQGDQPNADQPAPDDGPAFGVPDDQVGADIDCTAFAQAKYDSLAAHASQVENIFFLKLPVPVFTELMGHEEFVRERPARTDDTVEDDLFAGLR